MSLDDGTHTHDETHAQASSTRRGRVPPSAQRISLGPAQSRTVLSVEEARKLVAVAAPQGNPLLTAPTKEAPPAPRGKYFDRAQNGLPQVFERDGLEDVRRDDLVVTAAGIRRRSDIDRWQEIADLQAEDDLVQETDREARNLGGAITSAFSALMQRLDIIAKKETTMSIPEQKTPNITVNVEPTPVEVIVQPPPVNVAAPSVVLPSSRQPSALNGDWATRVADRVVRRPPS
jgi:hypothetical protein